MIEHGPFTLLGGCWQLCVVILFYHNYNHLMTIIYEGGGKKKTGVGPSGRGWRPFGVELAFRVGVGPSFLGLGLAVPSLGQGLAPGVGASFSGLGLALPVGLALLSLGIRVGPSFLFGVGHLCVVVFVITII